MTELLGASHPTTCPWLLRSTGPQYSQTGPRSVIVMSLCEEAGCARSRSAATTLNKASLLTMVLMILIASLPLSK